MRGRGGEDEEAARVKDASCLGGLLLGVDGGEEVEVVGGERERTGTALLEGNATFGIEPDAVGGTADGLGRAVDPADAGAGELTGEEQRPLTLAALDLQDPLWFADVEDGGGERG